VKLDTLIGEPWADYGLIDSGHGRKLERYGRFRFIRPEGQALWAPAAADWRAHAEFVPGSDEEGGGRWDYHEAVPRDGWPMAWDDVRFTAQTTPFRHLGFFPDMAPVWRWMRERIAGIDAPECLNLFGYTGVGTLARRGRRYDGILLDPPKFGRGPEGEVWRLEEGLPGLIGDCRRLLDADSRFLFLTVYAVRMSALAIGELLSQTFADLGGTIEAGELAVREEARGLLLPTAIWARWSRD
jgi:23S rRNA (cytosine1962-C5)-methyltransferase